MFAPVFSDNKGNKFILRYKEYTYEDEAEAHIGGSDALISFGLILVASLDGVVEIDGPAGQETSLFPSVMCTLGENMMVALIAGPVFEKAKQAWEDENNMSVEEGLKREQESEQV